MTFKKGDPRPPNSGRRKGSGNKLTFDIKQSLILHGPELARELVRIALHGKNEATRALAIRECFDRIVGKASQQIEGQVTYGISADLQRLLKQHDGNSRSIPLRTIDMENDAIEALPAPNGDAKGHDVH